MPELPKHPDLKKFLILSKTKTYRTQKSFQKLIREQKDTLPFSVYI